MQRYVFIGGLHRSGTSLLASLLGSHPEIDALADFPVPENEGVYLQGAIPHDRLAGVPGQFADDPDAHLTENSRFNSLGVLQQLSHQWDLAYGHGARLRLEKSPVNLLRSRLYQSLFPASFFIFVVRHPAAVALATRKWTERPLPDLLAHWGRAYAIALEDSQRIHQCYVLRYEDLITSPAATLQRLQLFLGLNSVPLPEEMIAGIRADGNDAYFSEWKHGVTAVLHQPFKICAEKLGYCLDSEPRTLSEYEPVINHYFRSIEAELLSRF